MNPRGGERNDQMNRQGSFRVVEIAGLGEEAVIVETDTIRLLLIDPSLSHEDRIDILGQVMASI